ncbi:MAG: AEC family transporter, partial [Halobacteria archaeon]|nr:AEC family transporter [Halobacteria archaeon]
RDVDPQPLSTVTVYVLVPALVFHSLMNSEVSGAEGTRVVVASVAITLVMWGVSEAVFGFLSPRDGRNALVLSSTFPNTANYGIPLSVFAFPSVGRTTAVLYVIGSTFVIYTLGVYVSSKSSGARRALRRVFELPLFYAMVAALALSATGVELPGSTTETLGLVGNSSIPVMLVILGLQLERTNPSGDVLNVEIGVVNFLRLVTAPLAALPVVVLLGFTDPDVARVVVLESSMPAAVTTVLLSVEFGEEKDADYASASVLTTTLLSTLTVTALVAVLRSGVVI